MRFRTFERSLPKLYQEKVVSGVTVPYEWAFLGWFHFCRSAGNPNVIHILPNRLQEITGKRIAIDGTLLTQRFHWAPMPQRYRHILGWYRLINELKSHKVGAVCIFDGPFRTAAKTTETERRKLVRSQIVSRSAIEVGRLQRLRKLSSSLKTFTELPAEERLQKRELLEALICETKMQTIEEAVGNEPDPSPPMVELGVEGVPVANGYLPSGFNTYSLSTAYEDVQDRSYFCDGGENDLGLSALYGNPSPQNIVDELVDLYRDYRVSSLGIGAPSFAKARLQSYSDAPSKMHDVVSESKLQTVLTQEEGHLWSAIVSSISQPADEETITSSILSDLASRSQLLSESYERRSKPPSSETYKESKMILRAMGIPYVDCDGPYEAEALASSLVIRGHAHFVASEDTDVLVYGAPMLRNLATRNAPLSLISGADIPPALHISADSFLDFTIMLGTDFSRRIKNIGPARALKLIQARENIENILEHDDQHISWDAKTRAAYLAQVKIARLVFRQLPEVPVHADLEMKPTDAVAVNELLMRYGLHREVMEDDWDFQAPLAGNYFGDSPLVDNP